MMFLTNTRPYLGLSCLDASRSKSDGDVVMLLSALLALVLLTSFSLIAASTRRPNKVKGFYKMYIFTCYASNVG